MHSATVVDFFAIEEVTRIKQTYGLDDLPPHQIKATRHPVARAEGRVIRRQVLSYGSLGKELFEMKQFDRNVLRRRKIAAGRLQFAVPSNEFYSQDSATGVLVHKPDRFG